MPVILELDALTKDDKIFLMEALLLWLHHYRLAQSERETFKHAVIIEEAHHILSRKKQEVKGEEEITDIILREIRELGEGIVLLDQHPSLISKPGLGNTYCTVAMNLKHRGDTRMIADCLHLDGEQAKALTKLEVGWGLVKLQDRYMKPFLVRFPLVEVEKGSVSVLETAMLHEPPLLPRDYRNPMTRQLIGVTVRAQHELSEPPVTLDELVAIIPALDEYALALLAPLFLFGPRPSELGHVLCSDYKKDDGTLRVISRLSTGFQTKGRRGKVWPVNAILGACLRPLLERSRGALFIKRRILDSRANPVLIGADEVTLAREFEARQVRLAKQVERPLRKEEIARISRQVWSDAGAVSGKDVRRELTRTVRRAQLPRLFTPKDVRHLFESMCEEAMLAPGVIRHLMGHGPQRGDALFNYNHVSIATLREQVAVLDARRGPLLDALLRRASELMAQVTRH